MAERQRLGAAGKATMPAARHRSRGVAALAILCACMVLFAATLRLAHSHTAAEQESGHCQICSSIHTAAPAAAIPVHITLHAAPEPVVPPAPKNPARIRISTLSDRAPPALA
ncbi:MAG: hypothetical protein WBD10_10195 [Acidobacteriaceae bacterium]